MRAISPRRAPFGDPAEQVEAEALELGELLVRLAKEGSLSPARRLPLSSRPGPDRIRRVALGLGRVHGDCQGGGCRSSGIVSAGGSVTTSVHS